jgi:hypothetical protein
VPHDRLPLLIKSKFKIVWKSISVSVLVNLALIRKVKIVYIDNNEATVTMFRQVTARFDQFICSAINDSKKAVIGLMELTQPPDAIVIHCAVKDIACKSLLAFIRKRELLAATKVIVVGAYISSREQRQFILHGASFCYTLKYKIEDINLFLNHLLTKVLDEKLM